eukprot:CAMPEP_0117428774 /NCGR_PEP_ID=MMETSP0758-20121206/8408_1 /TAXON_ID=63605 /ORGANISM="Percolomonas cosmopolitus, Strain AE-1 (ATCC 50343)" /LENGTH=166 /DNA_ID=CAMNT_0005215319 /DNA_START=87 /DNA_END=590 /DNA_ORIENTATION=+
MTAVLQVDKTLKAERMDFDDPSTGDSDVAVFYFDDEGIFYAKRPDPKDTTCIKLSESIPMGFTLDLINDLSRFYPLFDHADDSYNYFKVIIPAPMEILTTLDNNYPVRIDSPSMGAGVSMKDFKPTSDASAFTFDKTKCVEFSPTRMSVAWMNKAAHVVRLIRKFA